MRADAHKRGVRILALASGPAGSVRKTIVAGVVQREGVVEGVLSTKVSVDGTDSTIGIMKMIYSSKFRQQVRLLVFDGIALAGLNLIDPGRISESLEVDVLLLTRRKPRRHALENALRKYSESRREDVGDRLRILKETENMADYRSAGFYIKSTSDKKEGADLIRTAYEALRLAHFIARGVASGESRGRM